MTAHSNSKLHLSSSALLPVSIFYLTTTMILLKPLAMTFNLTCLILQNKQTKYPRSAIHEDLRPPHPKLVCCLLNLDLFPNTFLSFLTEHLNSPTLNLLLNPHRLNSRGHSTVFKSHCDLILSTFQASPICTKARVDTPLLLPEYFFTTLPTSSYKNNS